MKLDWWDFNSFIIMELSNKEKLEWDCSLWTRAGSGVNSSIFDVINEYWASLPHEQVLAFENVYRDIHRVFEECHDVHAFNALMAPLMQRLTSLFQWNHFRTWCLLAGNLSLSQGIKETMDEKDKIGLTYFTKDYEDLVVFSVFLKAIMPVWGLYHREYTNSVGKHYIHINAVDMLRNGVIDQLPPFLKLESYVNCFAEDRIKEVGFSLTMGVGTEEINNLLTALALIKKVIIYNARSPDHSIVTNVYHLLNERCQDVGKSKPRNRDDDENRKNEVSVTDQYKIAQRIPPGVSVMAECYLEDVECVVLSIDPTVPKDLIQQSIGLAVDAIQIRDFHIPILGIVLDSYIHPKTLTLIDFKSIKNAIDASSALLTHWGLGEIAALLTTIPQKKDYYNISMSASSGRSYSQLRPDMLAALDKLYPHLSIGKNPGVAFIEQVIREIVSFDWPVNQENFSDMRNSIAALLLRQQ